MNRNLNRRNEMEGGPPKKPTAVASASSTAVVKPPSGAIWTFRDRAGRWRGGLGKPAFSLFTAGVIGSTPPRVNMPYSTPTSIRGWGEAPALRINQQVVVEKPGSSKHVANVGKEGGRKHARPSKRAYYERKAAIKVLSRLRDVPANQLTVEQARSVEWAKGVVSSSGKPVDTAPKRQSTPDHTEEGVAKKTKIGGHKYPIFGEVVNSGGEVLGIVDRAEEEGAIPKEKWKSVEDAIAEVYLQVLEENPGPPPLCHDNGWYQGRAKLIACEDNRSAQLYRVAVSKVGEVWPGAKLVAISKEEIPSRPRARIRIPAKPAEPEKIEQIFKSCNGDLPTHNWKVWKIEEPVDGRRQVLLLLNAETLAPLAGKGWKVRFGFVDVAVRIYRNDEPALKLGEESDRSNLNSGDEERLSSSQYSTDSERLVEPLFNEDNILSVEADCEEVVEEDVDAPMVETKWADSCETAPNKSPLF
ncbi:uncharacterized protein LOC128856035 [Anastrepha ludens]|uniref:uncharacterized protein LOC128856035 n=1 Tax=Anastrepha ludens TaxID=28586 RepID=UPI0023AEE1A6|nr:uncharacterized protein LOC128856035 [Anastrepha ludens]